LKGSDGQYIYQNPGQGLPATIWNYPYETSDAFPTLASVTTGDQYILFGNLKQGAVFGDKQQPRVKLLDQATITDTDGSTVINLAEQDMVALRIVERVGYVVALAAALTVLEASATQS
jgi:HK97 family phage major capsid protein